MIHSWSDFVKLPVSEMEMEDIRKHERSGRPIGDAHFIDQFESKTGLMLRKKKPGLRGPRKNKQ
jgi:putative transposase